MSGVSAGDARDVTVSGVQAVIAAAESGEDAVRMRHRVLGEWPTPGGAACSNWPKAG